MPEKFAIVHTNVCHPIFQSLSVSSPSWLIAALVIIVLSFLLIPTARAELATDLEMSNVAQNWVAEMTAKRSQWAGDSNPTLGVAHDLYHEGVLVGRYYDVSPRGYVLVPALKELNPVKLYSDESNMGPSQEGGMLLMIKESLYERMQLHAQFYGSYAASQPIGGQQLFDASNKTEWDRLAVSTARFRTDQALSTMSEGVPLLTVSWHQSAPYNNDCPMGDGGRTVVGCVATATAQIMKFWEWPETGIGFYGYMWEGDNSCGGSTAPQTLTANFATPYDWANIPDDCNSGCSGEQNAALAELNYEVGVAHQMDYGACGSGAWTGRAAYILPTYFKYKNTTTIVNRDQYTQQEWFDLVAQEVEAGRPIQYRINMHSIVCDGWRDQGGGQLEFHMNYGWNEGHTTWYLLDNLYCGWVDGDICPYEEEYMIIGIEPQDDPALEFVNASVSDPTGNGNGHGEPGETLEVLTTIKNAGNTPTGITGTLSSTDPYLTVVSGGSTYDPSIAWGEQTTNQTPYTVSIDPACPDPYIGSLSVAVIADGGTPVEATFQVFVGTSRGLEDDFEAGEGDWTHLATIASFVDQWHMETYRHHSGTYSWKVGGDGSAEYLNSVDAALLTPPLLLPVDAKLHFWHWMDAELDGPGTAWDGGAVYVSENGGVWTQVIPEGAYPYVVTSGSSIGIGPGNPCYSGSFGWSEAIFDLSEYSGVVQIMFRFCSDGGVTEEGWYVDDVWIGNTPAGTGVTVTNPSGASVAYDVVLVRGNTSFAISDVPPAPPAGFAPVPEATPEYCEIATDAAFTGNVHICLTYDETGVVNDENELLMMHFNGDEWGDVTESLDIEANNICGQTSALSTFVVAEVTSCCSGRVGDANVLGGDEPTIGDISAMIEMLFLTGTEVPCLPEADVNQSGGFDTVRDDVTISDISVLVDYLFITGSSLGLADCL